MPVPMVSLRDYTLRSKTGHVIFFPGGQPVPVPDEVVAEAQSYNVAIADGVDVEKNLTYKATTTAHSAITGTLRDSLVFGAIEDLVRENDPSNFNAGGQPKVHAVNETTGLKLGGGEVSKYWERYRELKATNSPLPEHPRTEHVLELNRLTTRSQLLDYAKNMLGMDVSHLERKSLKEVKEVLVYSTINYHEASPTAASQPVKKSTLVEDD